MPGLVIIPMPAIPPHHLGPVIPPLSTAPDRACIIIHPLAYLALGRSLSPPFYPSTPSYPWSVRTRLPIIELPTDMRGASTPPAYTPLTHT